VFKDVAAEVADIAGNLVFDAHTAVLMREHGIRRIYTHDAHFRRFPFLDVIDPVQ
jgi:predicted nucleic acid-binding protein